MGQQPNIELGLSDLPRPTATPAAARRWRPQRPGELGSPDDVPWGGPFGTTGPDTGFALKLVADRDLDLGDAEHRHNVDAGVVAVVGARASHFGRAPTTKDVDWALALFGFETDGVPAEVVETVRTERVYWFANLGHDAPKSRALVASVSVETMQSSADEVRARMAAGERLVGI